MMKVPILHRHSINLQNKTLLFRATICPCQNVAI